MRFSIRAMFVGITILSVVAFVVREGIILQNARSRFQHVRAAWEANLVTLENYVVASKELMDIETNAPWVSQNAARRRHVQTRDKLLAHLNSGICKWEPGTNERQSEFIRREIKYYVPPSEPVTL
jgi:hypothetical protein